MQVELISAPDLTNVIRAIRMCHDSMDKSDSPLLLPPQGVAQFWTDDQLGPKDEDLLSKIIDMDHTSTLEHMTYTFEVSGISRAVLQELARHRIASLSVMSTRYTLHKMVKDAEDTAEVDGELAELGGKYCVIPPKGSRFLHCAEYGRQLMLVAEMQKLHGNDIAKYHLPEGFMTNLIWTINARSLRNFIGLRRGTKALWEIRDLALEVLKALPREHHLLLQGVDCAW